MDSANFSAVSLNLIFYKNTVY